MEDSNNTPSGDACCDWQHTIEDWNQRTRAFVQEDPTKAVGLAVFGGVLLTILPVGRLVGWLLRLSFALVRPVVLVLGAMKIYEELEKRQKP